MTYNTKTISQGVAFDLERSEIVAQLCFENSIQTLLNFFGVDPKKI